MRWVRFGCFLLILSSLALVACQSSPSNPGFNPFSFFGGGNDEGGGGGNGPGPVSAMERIVDLLVRFGWLSLALSFFIPGVRVPLIALWTAIIRALTWILVTPIDLLRDRFEESATGQRILAKKAERKLLKEAQKNA